MTPTLIDDEIKIDALTFQLLDYQSRWLGYSEMMKSDEILDIGIPVITYTRTR
jgi:hypothetical protein